MQRLVWNDSERDFKSGQRSLCWERYPLTWLTNQHVGYKYSGVKKRWACEIALCWSHVMSHDAGLRWSQDALIKFCSKEQSVIFCQAVSHSESETHLGSRRQGLQTSTGGTLEWFSWGWNWIIIGKRQSFFTIEAGIRECFGWNESLVLLDKLIFSFTLSADPSLPWRVFDVRRYS